MKSLKKSFYMIFLFSILLNFAFAQTNNKGTVLCDDVFTFLTKNEVHPQIQPLAASGINNLPYNIIVSFSPEDIKSEHNLVILFDMEDACNNKNLLLPVIEQLSTQKFNSTLVLCYGSTLNIPRSNIIYGSEVFVQSLNSNIHNSVYIFNLSAKKNSIISGSNGHHSPTWMTKDMFDAYSVAKLNDGLPLSFISQVLDYTFSTDRQFLSFLEADIPCVNADIKSPEKAEQVIKYCINSFEKSRFSQDDSHTFMFMFFGKRIWFSEYVIVRTLLVVIIMGFLLVFCVGFVNKTARKEFWQEIRSNWYVIPSIYILSVIGFFTGKGLYLLAVPESSTNYTVYGCQILQISLSMLFVSLFNMLNLSLLKKYTTRSLDFILVIDTQMNMVIFTLLDISLFPIFLMIYFFSVLSLIFRRNWVHIILFVFMVFPFIPYINTLFTISDSEKLHNMLVQSNYLPLLLSLILLPVYLMWLRILNAMKKRYAKKRIYALVISLAYILIFIIITILNRTIYSNRKAPAGVVRVVPQDDSTAYDFELSYDEKTVFSDIIRHITIVSNENPVYSSITVTSLQEGVQPVLYSENDFISASTETALFSMPVYPSQKLEFSYGSSNCAQIVTAEQIFYSQINGGYYSVIKTLEMKENSEVEQ